MVTYSDLIQIGILRQHRTMGASAFGGSFAPSVQLEKWEIHKVFPPFSNFQLEQNPSPKALAPLCGVALIVGIIGLVLQAIKKK